MGHYATQCPLKKDKDKKHDLRAATTRIEGEEFAMIAHISLGENWGDLEL